MCRAIAASAALLLTAACASLDFAGGACFEGDPRPWTRIEEPADASRYRDLADANRALGGWRYWREAWFSLPTGEITLCRLGEANRSGAAYEFAADGSLTDRGLVWITTQ